MEDEMIIDMQNIFPPHDDNPFEKRLNQSKGSANKVLETAFYHIYGSNIDLTNGHYPELLISARKKMNQIAGILEIEFREYDVKPNEHVIPITVAVVFEALLILYYKEQTMWHKIIITNQCKGITYTERKEIIDLVYALFEEYFLGDPEAHEWIEKSKEICMEKESYAECKDKICQKMQEQLSKYFDTRMNDMFFAVKNDHFEAIEENDDFGGIMLPVPFEQFELLTFEKRKEFLVELESVFLPKIIMEWENSIKEFMDDYYIAHDLPCLNLEGYEYRIRARKKADDPNTGNGVKSFLLKFFSSTKWRDRNS